MPKFYTSLTAYDTVTIGVDDAGHDVKFFGATAGQYLLWDESADDLIFSDNTKAAFGTGSDCIIYHNGTDTVINENTGDFYIDNTASDKDIIFKGNDGGATVTALTLDMSNVGAATFSGTVTATGGFAGDLTGGVEGNVTGNADSATVGTNVTVTDNNETNETTYITFVDGASGTQGIETEGKLTYNPSLNVLTSSRKFTVTSNTDGNYDGDVVYFGGTTSMTTGAIYHYKSDGTWELADADAVANCDGMMAVALGAASDTNGMLIRGMVTLDHDPGAVGDVLFLSTTAGDCSATAPSGNNDVIRVIGYCLNASNGQIWFDPDKTYVEVSA
jgi:hypothetical protein